jgi:hypothetical protein
MIRKIIIDEYGDIACYVHGTDHVKAQLVESLDDARWLYICDICDAWEDVEVMRQRQDAL